MGKAERNIFKLEDRLEYVAHNAIQKDKKIGNTNKQKNPKLNARR